MSGKSPITTHILDLGEGLPAVGVDVTLEFMGPEGPETVAHGKTDNDGRLASWFSADICNGHYRLSFATGAWYQSRGIESFYPQVVIDFLVGDPTAHYHVPLLLNQWGYSTYRGS